MMCRAEVRNDTARGDTLLEDVFKNSIVVVLCGDARK